MLLLEFKFYPKPQNVKIPENVKISRVACGFDFTACITENGKVYTWGNNKYGNLGVNFNSNSTDQNIVSTPTLVGGLAIYQVIQVFNSNKFFS